MTYSRVARCTETVGNLAFDAESQAIFAIVGTNKVVRVPATGANPEVCGSSVGTVSEAGAVLRRITTDGSG